MAKDLVCGMDLNKVTSVYTTEFEGKTYYFCSHRCMTMFKKDPKRYISQSSARDK